MKIALKVMTAIALSALVLTGCNPAPKGANENIAQMTPLPKTHDEPQKIEIDIDGIEGDELKSILEKLPVSGVQRRFKPDPSGVYTVEYVHSPRDESRDDTLDYRLELKNDNTFELDAVVDGVAASHYGHWYMHRGGNITMYYDEPVDPTAHNVYVSDSLYGEMICGGKIMIYENCNVIVLSRSNENNAETPDLAPDDGPQVSPSLF